MLYIGSFANSSNVWTIIDNSEAQENASINTTRMNMKGATRILHDHLFQAKRSVSLKVRQSNIQTRVCEKQIRKTAYKTSALEGNRPLCNQNVMPTFNIKQQEFVLWFIQTKHAIKASQAS